MCNIVRPNTETTYVIKVRKSQFYSVLCSFFNRKNISRVEVYKFFKRSHLPTFNALILIMASKRIIDFSPK